MVENLIPNLRLMLEKDWLEWVILLEKEVTDLFTLFFEERT